MTYTLLTFHFDRGLLASERLRGLQSRIDALESQAAVVAQGIYILCPEIRDQHRLLIEETIQHLRQLELHYVAVPFGYDPVPLWHLPAEAHNRLKQWDDEDPALAAP